MNKIKIAAAVMAAVMVFSAGAVAFAQTPTPPTPPQTATPSPYAQTFWQTLADKLGVTVDKLQQAVRDALKVTVAQLLKDGKLTQQQADNLDSRIDQFPFDKAPFGGFPGKRGPVFGHGPIGAQAILDAAAQKLGMTSRDLLTELRSGKTLTDIAKEKNVTPDDLKAAIVAAVNGKIDQAVKDGKLTQAQADQIKAQVNQMSLDNFFNYGFGKGWNRGWFNRPFGPRGNRAPQPATPQGSSS